MAEEPIQGARCAHQVPASVAAGFAGPEIEGGADAELEPLTLETLFDIYGEEVTPTKSERSRRYDRAAMKMFLRFFGKDRNPATLSKRDWDRFIRERRSGKRLLIRGRRRELGLGSVALVSLADAQQASVVSER